MQKKRITASIIESAALEIVDESGFQELSLKSLAQKLNIKSPSLYNHISNLAHLQKIVIHSVLRNLNKEIKQAAIGRSGSDALREMAAAYLDYSRQHSKLYQCILFVPSFNEAEIKSLVEEICDTLFTVIEPVIPEYENKILFTRGFRSILHGFTALEGAGYFQADIDNDYSFSYLIENYIKDFIKRESSGENE